MKIRIGSLFLAAASLVLAVPALQGCFPLVAAGAVGTGALIADDRRSSGTYLDDEGIEIKTGSRIGERFRDGVHVNVTSYNKVVLLTGEVFNEDMRLEVGKIAKGVDGVRYVVNETVVAPVSSLSSRSTDTLITSRVKSRFIEARKFQVNHVKVVTENRIVYLLGLVTKAEAESAASIAAKTGDVKKVVQVFETIEEKAQK